MEPIMATNKINDVIKKKWKKCVYSIKPNNTIFCSRFNSCAQLI